MPLPCRTRQRKQVSSTTPELEPAAASPSLDGSWEEPSSSTEDPPPPLPQIQHPRIEEALSGRGLGPCALPGCTRQGDVYEHLLGHLQKPPFTCCRCEVANFPSLSLNRNEIGLKASVAVPREHTGCARGFAFEEAALQEALWAQFEACWPPPAAEPEPKVYLGALEALLATLGPDTVYVVCRLPDCGKKVPRSISR